MSTAPGETRDVRALFVIADYGPPDDPAFAGVYNSLLQEIQPTYPPSILTPRGVAPWDELGAGYTAAASIVGRKPVPDGTVVLVNVAPRKDDGAKRLSNEGEGFVIARTPLRRNVTLISTTGGYSLSAIATIPRVDIRHLPIEQDGHQFRSRDEVPPALGRVLSGETPFEGLEPFAVQHVPALPLNTVAEVDGYKNIKTTVSLPDLKPGSPVTIVFEAPRYTRRGFPKPPKHVVRNAVVSGGSFGVKEGEIAFSEGSTGFLQSDGAFHHAAELFLRGGQAGAAFKLKPLNIDTGLIAGGATFRVYDADGHEVAPKPLFSNQAQLVQEWRPGPDLNEVLASIDNRGSVAG